MKTCRNFLCATGFALIVSGCGDKGGNDGNEPPPPSTYDNIEYLGAEGGGKYSSGGRGGRVYAVTNLADDGKAGSLRWALAQPSPKTIVFNVAGTIQLTSKLVISGNNITIAGQTAPGDGITIRDYPVVIQPQKTGYGEPSDIVIQFIRFRMGDEKGVQDDALGVQEAKNVLIDHCTMSWSTDECGSFYNNTNFTLQWCILSESLTNSIHDKGAHGYGGIWGGNNATFHHNLLAHHDSRNPRFDHDCVSSKRGPIDFVNNVIYNWGGNSTYGGENRTINIVNNYYKAGDASSRKNRIFNPAPSDRTSPFCGIEINTEGKYYITGNFIEGYSLVTADNWAEGVQGISDEDKLKFKVNTAFNTTKINDEEPYAAYSNVLQYAGVSYMRDAIDNRIVGNVRAGNYTPKATEVITQNGKHSKNGLIDSQIEIGGWLEPAGVPQNSRPTTGWDDDYDGMPNHWEIAQGLNSKNADDGNEKTLKPPYTNLEVYLSSLVEHLYP